MNSGCLGPAAGRAAAGPVVIPRRFRPRGCVGHVPNGTSWHACAGIRGPAAGRHPTTSVTQSPSTEPPAAYDRIAGGRVPPVPWDIHDRPEVGLMRLQDKVAIITGAGSGMGRVAAQLFAAEGAKVVVAEFDEAGGNQTVESVQEAGGKATFI